MPGRPQDPTATTSAHRIPTVRAAAVPGTASGAVPGAVLALGVAMLALAAAGAASWHAGIASPAALGVAAALWSGVSALVLSGLAHHPHARFGAANVVTTARTATAVALIALAVAIVAPGTASAGLAGGATTAVLGWASGAALVALALDGVDGALARASGLTSAFGTRYDMETDALLALALALLIWRSGELGPWVLALGTPRYLFLGAARALPALRAPLYPSWHRKAICVLQVATLCAVVSPLFEPPLSTVAGLVATAALAYSFARDTRWLLRREGGG